MRRLRPWALVLGGLLFAAVAAGPPRSYPHSAVLDGAAAYRLHWGRRGSALAFRLEVRTRGYVGFGLSASGGMASADIVVGGVERGQPYLQVRPRSFPSPASRRRLLGESAAWTPLPAARLGSSLSTHLPPAASFSGRSSFSAPLSFAASSALISLPLCFFLAAFWLFLLICVPSFSVHSLPTFLLNFCVGFVKSVRFPSSLTRKCKSLFLSP